MLKLTSWCYPSFPATNDQHKHPHRSISRCFEKKPVFSLFTKGAHRRTHQITDLYSILPVISKVIEKHVTKHLFGYLNKYKLLHDAQSGFRKHHSCQTALIKLTIDWLENIDKENIIGAIFFDLRKAFDVVDHGILLQKIAVYGIKTRPVNWFKSYLPDRCQCIARWLEDVKDRIRHKAVCPRVLYSVLCCF